MPDRPSADRTAELLFWYYRRPSRYLAEGRRRDAPLVDPEVVLKLALLRPVEFAAATWNEPRRIPALQESAEAYVRHMYFRPDATPYQVLGLEPGASAKEIKESFRLLMQLVHPDRQGARKTWPDACAAQANWAYGALRDQETRRTFEEEAEARAALARAINRAAMEAEASQMPVKVWSDPPPKGRRGIPHAVLPEWLTAGVGGFVRHNPATTAFGVLTTVALLIVGAAMWEGGDGLLVRVAREVRGPALRDEPSVGANAPRLAVSEPPAPARRAALTDAEKPVVLASIAPGMGTAQAASDAGSLVAQDAPAPVAVPTPIVLAPPTPMPADRVAEPARAAPAPVVAPPVAAFQAPVQVARIETSPVSEPAAVQALVAAPLAAVTSPPANAEIEALFATFVDTYEHGRLDAFAALFADDADTNLRRGRTAIRGEYDELFRLSEWRKMKLTRMNWRSVGDKAVAKGEVLVRIGWRDGREVEQRLNLDMELARRDGRVVIARMSHQPKNP